MAEQRHWSFDDALMLREKVFPDGFAHAQTTLPSGPFNPAADYEASYDFVYCSNKKEFNTDARCYYGSLRLKTEFKRDAVDFSVKSIRQTAQDFRKERQHLQAKFTTRRDELFSLKPGSEWALSTTRGKTKVMDARLTQYTGYSEKGRLKDGFIEKTNAAEQWFRFAETGTLPVSTNWSLIAAVQLLARDRSFDFGCFQEVERFFPGHQIQFYKTIEAQFGANTVALHGYVQKGAGILPQFYWVDDAGRLLISRFAMGMLVYNANPRIEKIAAEDLV
jgi:hypothetical protein